MIFAGCGPCCSVGKSVVPMVSDPIYIPDDHIVIEEPNRPEALHTPSEIRPGEPGAKFIIYVGDEPAPSVTIDLDVPFVTTSTLEVCGFTARTSTF